jgi:putative Mg2+ transporter-C (MgtC) family protein
MNLAPQFPLFWAAGQGWLQIGEIAAAFALSSLIGLEREIRQKSAGLRTHTLVGVGAALFILVSKYGFMDVLSKNEVVLDPSRVAAQVVSGIGFIGGGLIFVRRDSVQGLTTAAIVWVTAAIGMACGAGLFLLAAVVTACHFVVVLVYPRLMNKIPRDWQLEADQGGREPAGRPPR